ncbi:type IV pilin protein [Cellulomonas sp. SLBN-39]|uniref:type IV pilin protein n=1 Tax=Cellulomonas sp. SLBN-39 TaxID=2768446 RepID=UPI00115079E4|nr:type IV pilus assembly protein PilA [Cellulomonas sp. SLBN-39]
MIARIRKAMDEKEQGFTLVELLVVVIIIGILAAIAIPVFLNQRQGAVDAGIKSDLRTIATTVETAFINDQEYPASASSAAGDGEITINGEAVALSHDDTVIVYTNNNDGTYQITGRNTAAGTDTEFVYLSDEGGLQ